MTKDQCQRIVSSVSLSATLVTFKVIPMQLTLTLCSLGLIENCHIIIGMDLNMCNLCRIRTSTKQEHSESANSAKAKIRSAIRIRIYGLMWIRIRISAGSLPKCTGLILLSARVIAPSSVKTSAGHCMRNANKSPKIPYSRMVRNGKVLRNPHPGPNHHQKLITYRASPCPYYRVAQIKIPHRTK